MQIEDFTASGALRRWYLLNGVARCPFNAVDPAQISADDKAAILARNATVREEIEAVEAYEAALPVSKQDEPEPATEEVPKPGTGLTPGEPPEMEERETAAHARWVAARATVDAATEETKALAQRRTGYMTDDGEEDPFTGKPLPPKPYPADPVPEDDLVLLPEPVVVPTSVHAYQFAGQAAYEGIITVDEAQSWAGAGVVPKSLQSAVDKLITDPEEHDRVTFLLVGATDFPRYNGNTIALAKIFGKDTPEKLDAFFVAAGNR